MKAIELQRCARVAIETRGRVRPKERVLIVTIPCETSPWLGSDGGRPGGGRRAGAHGHADAAQHLQEPRPRFGPPCRRRTSPSLYDVFANPLVSTRGGPEGGARIITMPGVTEDGFLRTLSVDMDRLVRLTNGLADRVDGPAQPG